MKLDLTSEVGEQNYENGPGSTQAGNKKFRSNANTTSRYDKENSGIIENNPKGLFGFKRRHSETNDENEENLNALNLKSLQSYNQSSAIANALTPKRNCFNNNSGKG